jgi:hypothetical protein
MEIALADKNAQTLLDIGHAVADEHAIKWNRAFYRALFTYCLIQTFAGRQSGVEGELTRRDLTTNRAGNSKPALSHFTDEMTSLSKRWENKLEILIQDSETRDRVARERETQPAASVAPTILPVPDSTLQLKNKRAPRDKPPCFTEAVKILKKNPQITLRQFCKVIDGKAQAHPKQQKYRPPKSWKVETFFDQYHKRSNTVSRFLNSARTAASQDKMTKAVKHYS